MSKVGYLSNQNPTFCVMCKAIPNMLYRNSCFVPKILILLCQTVEQENNDG